MNIRSPIVCALLGASLLLSACQSPPEAPPLAGARIGGPFALQTTGGRTVRDSDFAGQYRLIYFGYTFCPDVCPVDLNDLMLGLRAFERQSPALAARVQPLFITVDPARDTPDVVSAYAARFHPRLIGLTGSPETIADVARKFLVTYRQQPGATAGSYLVAHMRIAYLFGPDGKPVAIIPTDEAATPDINEGAPERVTAELARWVR